MELAKQNGATLIVGTDPDADRVGIMVRSDTGDYVPFTGNQTGALLCDYLDRRQTTRRHHARVPRRT